MGTPVFPLRGSGAPGWRSAIGPQPQRGGASPVMPRKGDVVRSCKPFFLQLDTLFSGTVGQATFNQSQIVDYPVVVRGATLDPAVNLANRVQLVDPEQQWQFSNDYVLFNTLAGQISKNEIYQWWRRPYFLNNRQPLRGQFLNDFGNSDGSLFLLCDKADSYLYHKIPGNSKDFWLPITIQFTGVANQVITSFSTPVDYDLLILGATFSGGISTNTFQVYDDSVNYLWSSNPIGAHIFWGLVGQNQPMLWYASPFYLPRNGRIKIIANNVASTNATQYINFVGITLAGEGQASDTKSSPDQL